MKFAIASVRDGISRRAMLGAAATVVAAPAFAECRFEPEPHAKGPLVFMDYDQADLDAARERYFDLYDLAPIAYCTINEQGLIWEANLATATLFGVTRNALLNRPFSRHIFSEDQDIYYLGRKRLAADVDPQSVELREAARAPWIHRRA